MVKQEPKGTVTIETKSPQPVKKKKSTIGWEVGQDKSIRGYIRNWKNENDNVSAV